MKNVDMSVGNDDWKDLDVPKFDDEEKCKEWCLTQPGVNGFVYDVGTKLCFAKTGDVKMTKLPCAPSCTTYGGVLPCP